MAEMVECLVDGCQHGGWYRVEGGWVCLGHYVRPPYDRRKDIELPVEADGRRLDLILDRYAV